MSTGATELEQPASEPTPVPAAPMSPRPVRPRTYETIPGGHGMRTRQAPEKRRNWRRIFAIGVGALLLIGLVAAGLFLISQRSAAQQLADQRAEELIAVRVMQTADALHSTAVAEEAATATAKVPTPTLQVVKLVQSPTPVPSSTPIPTPVPFGQYQVVNLPLYHLPSEGALAAKPILNDGFNLVGLGGQSGWAYIQTRTAYGWARLANITGQTKIDLADQPYVTVADAPWRFAPDQVISGTAALSQTLAAGTLYALEGEGEVYKVGDETFVNIQPVGAGTNVWIPASALALDTAKFNNLTPKPTVVPQASSGGGSKCSGNFQVYRHGFGVSYSQVDVGSSQLTYRIDGPEGKCKDYTSIGVIMGGDAGDGPDIFGKGAQTVGNGMYKMKLVQWKGRGNYAVISEQWVPVKNGFKTTAIFSWNRAGPVR